MADKFDLTAALKTLRISRAQLARELGIHYNTVSKWTPETVPGYARAYIQCKRDALQTRSQYDAALQAIRDAEDVLKRARAV